MAKKIFFIFLIAGIFFFLGATHIVKSADNDSENKNTIMGPTQEYLEKEIIPAWRQCVQIIKDFYIEIKNFIAGKIKAFNPKEAFGNIKEEFEREKQELKESFPETFKGLVEWFKEFKESWFGKQQSEKEAMLNAF